MSELFIFLSSVFSALIVAASGYLFFKKFFDEQAKKNQFKSSEKLLPIRLQAYERLILLCERIDPPSLLVRIPAQEKSAPEYRLELIFNIQQEFEHNITQQLYVSDQLWQIITLTKNQTIELISIAFEKTTQKKDTKEFIQHLLKLSSEKPSLATLAIKKEISTLF
jgi:hypothetical protein